MRNTTKILGMMMWMAGAWACVGPSEDVERVDHGAVSVAAGDAADGLAVTVILDTCLSSSCDTDRSASCSAELKDGRIVVTSRFEWTDGGQNACTDDCGSLQATCALGTSLEDGSYPVDHGDDTANLTIAGGAVESLCFGDEGPFSCQTF